MTSKASAVWGAAGAVSSAGDFATAAGQWPFPLSSELLAGEDIRQLGFEDFRVALVPFQSMAPGANGSAGHATNQVVLLPMTWKQLMLQVREEATRPSGTGKLAPVRFGEISIDWASMEVRRSSRIVSLTRMEFKVLKYFVANPNRAISRDDLLDQVWGYANYPCTRTVDNHILRLRQKLEPDITHPVHFHTVHGLGYKFTP